MGIKYNMTEPPSQLKNRVNNFFRLKGENKTYNLFHFADCNAKLLFIKSGKIGFCNSNNLKKTSLHNGRVVRTQKEVPLFKYPVVLLGPCQNYCLVKMEGEIDIVGVELQATGIWYLLADNVDKYADSITEISDDIISGIMQLADFVFSATDDKSIFTALSMFLSSKNIASSKDQDNIEKVIKFMNNKPTKDNILEIATNIGTTSKQLLRLSKKIHRYYTHQFYADCKIQGSPESHIRLKKWKNHYRHRGNGIFLRHISSCQRDQKSVRAHTVGTNGDRRSHKTD